MAIVAAIWLAVCATLSEPPDPARIEVELLASRTEEHELVQSTVAGMARRQRTQLNDKARPLLLTFIELSTTIEARLAI